MSGNPAEDGGAEIVLGAVSRLLHEHPETRNLPAETLALGLLEAAAFETALGFVKRRPLSEDRETALRAELHRLVDVMLGRLDLE